MPAIETTDPICGMEVDASSSFCTEHQQKTYFICSANCQQRFEADAESVFRKGRAKAALGMAAMAAASAATPISSFGTFFHGTLISTVTFLLTAVCLCGTPGCQSASGRQERYTAEGRAAPQRALPTKPKPDLRELRSRLLGRSMQRVLAMLGKPETVVTLGGGLEAWDYVNAAYDSITGRPVGALTVWFQDRKVERISASF